MNRHSDVLAIGGGIIGLASAYYLAKKGKGVRLVEQDSIGAGASDDNCGLIFTSHLIPLCVPGAIRQEIKRMFRRTSPLYVSLAPDIKRLMWLLNFASKCNPGHMTHDDYTADDYVLTTGAWTPQITRRLGLNIPIQPGKGYSITMARPAICPKIPCYFYE
jgi:glycine/D-amino acid oxidase-like deaminating enzyme